MWQRLGEQEMLADAPWPAFDAAAAQEPSVTLVVTVAGKLRDRVVVDAGLSEAQALEAAMKSEKVRAALKERVALKEKIKDAQSDLDLLQREYQLDQDSFYSSPEYAKNTSGKEKLDAMKQQISNKQQELDQLKARLAALPAPQEGPATTPKP